MCFHRVWEDSFQTHAQHPAPRWQVRVSVRRCIRGDQPRIDFHIPLGIIPGTTAFRCGVVHLSHMHNIINMPTSSDFLILPATPLPCTNWSNQASPVLSFVRCHVKPCCHQHRGLAATADQQESFHKNSSSFPVSFLPSANVTPLSLLGHDKPYKSECNLPILSI